MQAQSITSLLQYFDITEPTWRRGEAHSQIDNIWISNSLTLCISKPEIICADLITNSDHKIVTTTWQLNAQIKKYRPKTKKRSIYLYNKMKQDN